MAIIEKLSAIGDAIREKTQTTETMKLDEMPAKIRSIETGGGGVPDEILNPTSGKELYYGSAWNWVLEKYGDQINFSNVDTFENMFKSNTLTKLPFATIDMGNGKKAAYMFWGADIEKAPALVGKVDSIDNLFYSCTKLKDTSNVFSAITLTESNNTNQAIYSNCFSLRKADISIFQKCNYTILKKAFEDCSTLDEIIDLPVIVTGPDAATNVFSNTFIRCYRLKRLTFKKLDKPINMTDTEINLSTVGYVNGPSWADNEGKVINYNSGITVNDKVNDDLSYQKLKNTENWYAGMDAINWSRYNLVSARETLESLPELVPVPGGNKCVIKFRNNAGQNTDGGSVSDLNRQEIAAAAAKGWTVSFM